MPQLLVRLQQRHAQPQVRGELQRDVDVFHHEIELERIIEPAAQDPPDDVGPTDPRHTRRGVQYARHRRGLQTVLGADGEPFRRGEKSGGRDQIVDGLHRVAAADRPQVEDTISEHFQQRHDTLHRLWLSADHEDQLGVQRADLCPRHRCIDHVNAEVLESLRSLSRVPGLGRRRVEQQTAAPQARNQALFAEHDGFDFATVRQHRHNYLGNRSYFVRSRRESHIRTGPQQLLPRRRIDVVGSQRESGRGEMTRHGQTHDTQPHEPYGRLAHGLLQRAHRCAAQFK